MWPSEILRGLLDRKLPPDERDAVLGDLDEEYRERVLPSRSRPAAEAWYAREALSLLLSFAREEIRANESATAALTQNRFGEGGTMGGWTRDAKHALKVLTREPFTALVVAATLALGIGANTAMFSVVDGALLRPLPYPEEDRLVRVFNGFQGTEDRFAVSPLDIRDIEARSDLVEVHGAYTTATFHLARANGQALRLEAAAVSTGFFRLMGYQPYLGRTFTADDEVRGQHRSAILSHGLWTSEFGADSAVVGQTITLDSIAFQVAGVAPADFRVPRDADLWAPLALDPNVWYSPDRRGWQFLTAYGRLRRGVTPEAAGSGLTEQMAETAPDRVDDLGQYLLTVPLREHLLGDTGPVLALLMGAMGFVLLMACANLISLLLARAEARNREFAVRRALGCAAGSLARLVFLETLVLALVGGVAGTALASGVLALLTHFQVESLAALGAMTLDGRVLAFTGTVTLATTLLFGLGPALRAAGSSPQSVLRETSSRGGSSRRARGVRGTLVTLEVALATVLLVGVASSLHSFQRLLSTDPGFRPEGVLAATFEMPAQGYPMARRAAFYRSLEERIAALPGVASAGLSSVLPLEGRRWSASIDLIDPHPTLEGVDVGGNMRSVSPDYFRTMGIPLLEGRAFNAQDRVGAPPVAVVDELMARQAWPDGSAVGRQIILGALDPNRPTTIVGVVGSVRDEGLGQETHGHVYFPAYQRALRAMTLVTRAGTGEPQGLTPAIRAAIRDLEPLVPVYRVETLESHVSESVAGPRLTLLILTGFGGVALVLAAVGIYGVLSYTVGRRTSEIGTRIALGAQPSRVVRMVVGQVMGLWLVGIAAGVAGSLAMGSTIRSLLFEVDPVSPAILAATISVLGLTALAAALIPARRAATIDCVEALRVD